MNFWGIDMRSVLMLLLVLFGGIACAEHQPNTQQQCKEILEDAITEHPDERTWNYQKAYVMALLINNDLDTCKVIDILLEKAAEL